MFRGFSVSDLSILTVLVELKPTDQVGLVHKKVQPPNRCQVLTELQKLIDLNFVLCSNLVMASRMPIGHPTQAQVTRIVLQLRFVNHSKAEYLHHSIIGKVSIVASWRPVARISEQAVVLLVSLPHRAAHKQNP